ncbi:MAG TPA: hypothetical protein VFW75_02615, partial [Acetobacteraceae bacterium]|nr:hypothetical protein [Acetobacteraceae bacterium]
DTKNGGGHFVVNGKVQPANTQIVVAADDLSSISYVGGKRPGHETIEVGVYDATTNADSPLSALTATTTRPHHTIAGQVDMVIGFDQMANSFELPTIHVPNPAITPPPAAIGGTVIDALNHSPALLPNIIHPAL